MHILVVKMQHLLTRLVRFTQVPDRQSNNSHDGQVMGGELMCVSY
jgi:hypothetical protein